MHVGLEMITNRRNIELDAFLPLALCDRGASPPRDITVHHKRLVENCRISRDIGLGYALSVFAYTTHNCEFLLRSYLFIAGNVYISMHGSKYPLF